MGEQFYRREQEVRSQQERLKTRRDAHTTIETVHLEQQAAQENVAADLDAKTGSLLDNLKASLRKLLGRA